MSTSPIIVREFHRSETSLPQWLIDSDGRVHRSPEVKFLKDVFGYCIEDPAGQRAAVFNRKQPSFSRARFVIDIQRSLHRFSRVDGAELLADERVRRAYLGM